MRLTSEFGAPTDTKEAICFALIGWHTVPRAGGHHPQLYRRLARRGSSAPSCPGATQLRLPEPLTTAPRALRLEAPVA